MNRIRKALKDRSNTRYCLKLDLKKFYHSIDQNVLIERLHRKIKDETMMQTLIRIIHSYGPGLAIGYHSSQLLGNFYLCLLDHYIKCDLRVKYYFRYCDDIVILASDKDTLHDVFSKLRELVEGRLHLTIKQNWQIFPVEARGIDFLGCDFEHLGSTGLDYVEGTRGGLVEDCLFRDIAGNGLVVGSFSPAAHETHQPYDPADRRELCTFQIVRNNLFTDVTNEDWGCVAIAAGYVADITIEHNEINEVSYTGISLGWGWTQTVNCMRNNVVRANLIHHYAKHMYDTAGIYTLGAQPKSYVVENVVHSIYTPGYAHDPNHWFYLYTDEGSSFITVKDNWTEGEKFLKNANGPGNVWENNGPMVSDSIKARAGLLRPIER